MSDKTTRALHTLWQAAGGFATADLLVQEFATHDNADLKTTLIATGTAVFGAALSMVKSFAVNWSASHKQSKALADAKQLDVIVQAVEKAYEARHVTGVPVV